MRLRSTIAISAAALMLVMAGPATAATSSGPALAGDETLRARYALPNSQFIEIDGEPVHYVDEGKGDAILLVHGSFASLRQWNDWAKALSRHNRVIRFDMAPAGLSGPNPAGDYTVARKVKILGDLTRKLGVETFIIVATSSGGVPAAAFAVEHPDRVNGLVLNNIAVGRVQFDTSSFSPAFKQALADDAKGNGVHKPDYWRQIMLHNFADDSKVTPALVQEWTELNNRYAQMPAEPKVADVPNAYARTREDLPKITAPTLLLWSADDHETTVEREAKLAMELLTSKDKSLTIIPNCGHMMPYECGTEALVPAKAFIDRISAKKR